jgi:pimeloyl-ACP methyl ester carboxylesterase
MPTPLSDVVVVLPGLMGSVLSREGKDVWSASHGALLKAFVSGGEGFRSLTLRGDDVEDGVVATRVMSDVHLIPGLWKIDGYSGLVDWLARSFSLTEGKNLFAFPYDWRRDNRASAKTLDSQARGWLADWRKASGDDRARLVLVGHSMGGLVARYFLEVLEGWSLTRALVTFGTPHRGSLNALDTLANGVKKATFDLTGLARSLPSVYQLLPLYECYDSGSGALKRLEDSPGIPNVDPARVRAALQFHREIRDAVEQHRKLPEYRENGYGIHPIVGISQPTLQSARLEGPVVKLFESYQGRDDSGDGTVPRASATPDEVRQEGREAFASTRHAGLQNTESVRTQLEGILTGYEMPVYAPPAAMGLQVEDLYLSGEDVSVQVRCPAAVTPSVTIRREGDGAALCTQILGRSDEEWRTLNVPPPPPGVYRVEVTGGSLVEPVQDVFAVAPPAGQ